MQLSRSYQLANPSLTIEFVKVLFDTSANKGWRPSGSEVVLGASVRGIGGGEYLFKYGNGVVGRTWPYATTAPIAKQRASATSKQIKQVSVSDFTHGSLLVVILVIPSGQEPSGLSVCPSFPRRLNTACCTPSSCSFSLPI